MREKIDLSNADKNSTGKNPENKSAEVANSPEVLAKEVAQLSQDVDSLKDLIVILKKGGSQAAKLIFKQKR
jgi:hypothetical protein